MLNRLISSTFAFGLKQATIIQKARAILLVLVLTVGITPKSFFHDLIANHKDYSDCRQIHKSTAFHQQGFNCHFDDLVVTVPYLLVTEQPVVSVNFYFEKRQPSFYSSILSSFSQHKESRGPPSA